MKSSKKKKIVWEISEIGAQILNKLRKKFVYKFEETNSTGQDIDIQGHHLLIIIWLV